MVIHIVICMMRHDERHDTWTVIHIVIFMMRHVERYDTWSNIVRLCMSYVYDHKMLDLFVMGLI